MTLYALTAAVEQGLIYALVVLGLYLSYRVLNIPDLTVDGSFTLGAAVSVVLAGQGHPVLALCLGALAGAGSGLVTALLQTKLKVQPILAGIITMTALYSINMMVMDNRANLAITPDQSLFPRLGLLLPLGLALLVTAALFLFLHTPLGLAVRATGDNESMVRSSSVPVGFAKAVGLGIANACVALGGALYAQDHCFAEVRMGIGMVVIGLASLLLGEMGVELLFGRRAIPLSLLAALLGSVLYRLIIALALELNLSTSSLKLITAVIVALAMSAPALRESLALAARKAGKREC